MKNGKMRSGQLAVAGVGRGERQIPLGTVVVRPESVHETDEERIVDLTRDGLACIPTLERQHRKSALIATCGEHVHDGCTEIVFCQRGVLTFESMGRQYPFRPGMVFLSRPDEPHRIRVFPRGMLSYGMLFRGGRPGTSVLGLPPRESDELRERIESIERRLFRGGEGVRTAFRRIFSIYDEEERGTAWRTLRLRSAVLQLLLVVIEASSDSVADARGSILQEIISDIRENPALPFSVDDLAERARLAPNNLIRRFRELTGLPPLAFRNACRIDRAKSLLQKGNLSISRIALELGYSSKQNFATRFRLATGSTPRDWRTKVSNSDKVI